VLHAALHLALACNTTTRCCNTACVAVGKRLLAWVLMAKNYFNFFCGGVLQLYACMLQERVKQASKGAQ
jgi:hypothetical protein